ncbi:MAG: Penicillinase repressor [Firmicutes bacterium ADurb.Bin182]|nr:MAG: Penicillinase repressor [Firmicutes bacterium ADurb.Bin182]
MERNLKLYDAEYRMVNIVWKNEPLHSRELTELCAKQLGWKRSTTYTVLKKLCDRGILKNDSAIVTSLVSQGEVQRYEAEAVMGKSFGGSLPKFITAFLDDKKLSAEQVSEIKRLIDRYKED